MQQVNLYQAAFRKSYQIFSAVSLLYMSLVLMVMLVLIYLFADWQTRSLQQDADNMRASLAQRKVNLEELKKRFPEQDADRQVSSRVEQLKAAVEQKQRILQVLSGGGVHGNKEGFSEVLTGFARRHVEGVWLDSVAIDKGGKYLDIEGKAVQAAMVPDYIKRLSRDEVFRGMEFAVFELAQVEKEEGSQVSFSLRSSDKKGGGKKR